MYTIKQISEDFVVVEKSRIVPGEKGDYSYYRLKKKGYDTVKAISLIAAKLGVDTKYINYAGTKDRYALTTQMISIKKGPQKDLELEDIELKFLGKGDERLNLGILEGNSFRIVVRNIYEKPVEVSSFENYFDEQRFGSYQNNHIIGKLLIQKKFKEACEEMKGKEREKLTEHLSQTPNDYVGFLQQKCKHVVRLYIHAYQSYLWNETVRRYIRQKKQSARVVSYALGDLYFAEPELETLEVPFVGFDMPQGSSEVSTILDQILGEEGITERDFIIKELPNLSSEGGMRSLYASVQDLTISELEEDELNTGAKKCTLSFSLGKGSYATMAVRKMCAPLPQ